MLMKTNQRTAVRVFSFIIIFFVIMFTSCTTVSDVSEIKQINYGTSFGECIGYCKHDISIRKGLITYNCSGWIDTIHTITRTETLSDSLWNSVRANLKLNAFLDLPEVIGCPDCADGGAEWLEIVLNSGAKHKVTFEYGNEPQTLKSYLPVLREMLTKNSCNQ
jgi:hypothetical protein